MKSILSKDERMFAMASAIILGIFALISFAPFMLIAISSISSTKSLVTKGYSFFPSSLSLDSYLYMLAQGKIILRSYGVSFFVTTVGTITSLIITPMLAYPLSRKDFKLRGLFTFLVFFSLLFNGGVVPSYIMWARLFSLKNTIWALIIPTYLMYGFNVLLVKNYFEGLPEELEESARIDGCSRWGAFYRITLPLLRPGLLAGSVLVFANIWNEFVLGYALVLSDEVRLVQVGIYANVTEVGIRWGPLTAAAIGASLPVVIAYAFMQRAFIQGLSAGAVKG